MIETKQEKQEWMTRLEVAKLLRINPQTIAKWACYGGNGLPFTKFPGQGAVRYLRSDVEEFLQRGYTGKKTAATT